MSEQKNIISRRDFILNTTLASAGILGVPMALAASHKKFNNKSKNNNSMNNDNSPFANRKLGSLEVTELGFGCMNIAWAYGNPPAKEEAIKLIRGAYAQGVRFFDTAEIYGPHISEKTTGEALRPFRNSVVIASKIGFDIDFQTAQLKGGLNS